MLQRIFKTDRSREFLLAGTLLLAAGLAGCNTADLNPSETLTQGYVLDEKALEFVPVGSSREQVQLSLGSPSTTATFDNEVYYYISQKRHRTVAFMNPRVTERRILAVYFDKDGKVASISNYGLQDGKVFDFISRTTPTGGKDLVVPRTDAGWCRQGALPGCRRTTIAITASPDRKTKNPRNMFRGFFVHMLMLSVRKHGKQKQGHDVGDLDRRIDGRAGRILVGIANSITGD